MGFDSGEGVELLAGLLDVGVVDFFDGVLSDLLHGVLVGLVGFALVFYEGVFLGVGS